MSIVDMFPPTSTRVANSTDPRINENLRAQTDAEIARMEHADGALIADRLAQLDREWDVERVLQANASTLVMIGVALGVTVNRRYLLLPIAVFTFLAQHALQGWCPPIPVIRRLGVRTRAEIERERNALKALRGDYDRVPPQGEGSSSERVLAALNAVDA